MAVDINVEQVLPCSIARGAGIEAEDVDAVGAEMFQYIHQTTGFMRYGKADGGAVLPAGACVLSSDDNKSCCVRGNILHLFSKDVEPVEPGCQRTAQGSSTFCCVIHGHACSCSAAGCGNLVGMRVILLQPVAALPQNLRMRIDGADFGGLNIGHETVLDTLVHLGADAEVGVGKEVHRLHDVAVRAVLKRNYAVVDFVALYGCKNVGK